MVKTRKRKVEGNKLSHYKTILSSVRIMCNDKASHYLSQHLTRYVLYIIKITIYSRSKGNKKNKAARTILWFIRDVWFYCFLFSFLLKTENGDENMFSWISKNIFSENENRKQPKMKIIHFRFQCFQLRTKISFRILIPFIILKLRLIKKYYLSPDKSFFLEYTLYNTLIDLNKKKLKD